MFLALQQLAFLGKSAVQVLNRAALGQSWSNPVKPSQTAFLRPSRPSWVKIRNSTTPFLRFFNAMRPHFN
jgi:hypothetical protein